MKTFSFLTFALAVLAPVLAEDAPSRPMLRGGSENINEPDDEDLSHRGLGVVPNSYIVRVDPECLAQAAGEGTHPSMNGLLTAFAQKNGVGTSRVFEKAIQGFVATGVDKVIAQRLELDDCVKSIEADQIAGGDAKPANNGGGGGDAPPPSSQQTPYGVTRVNGGTYTGNKKVFVLDTGIDSSHPDLNVHPTLGFSAFTGREAKFDDFNGHGTHVAGIIGAMNNDFGYVGVAAGATLVPVKINDSSNLGLYSGWIDGLEYVLNNAVAGDVVNLSAGGSPSEAVDEAVLAVANQGIFISLSAGNGGGDTSSRSPSRVNHPNIWTVAAMDENDTMWLNSNSGNSVDTILPGVDVWSTYPGNTYGMASGTSMAAPHAAGIMLMNGSPACMEQGTVGSYPVCVVDSP